MLQSAPANISNYVIAFCSEITPEPEPIYLLVEPFNGSTPNECYINVGKYIQANGGSVQYGWQIWEWSNIMIEAEFHAVWVSPNGQYKDVTPKDFGINKILFLPDPNRRYEEKQINNIRKALKNTQAIKDYIQSADRMFELLNEGDLANQHGAVGLTLSQATAIQDEQQNGQRAFLRILQEEGIKSKDLFSR
jgi:hypothetical protein